MIELAPHPTVNEIRWIPELTFEGDLVPGKQYTKQVIWRRRRPDPRAQSGVDTIGWVGGQNPYFTGKVLQVADTTKRGTLLPTSTVTVTRGATVRF